MSAPINETKAPWRFGTRQKLLLVIATLLPVWVFFATPKLLSIPKNFSYKADVISVDNFYDEKIGEYKGEQYSKTTFTYDVESFSGSVLQVRNTFDVRTLDGKRIFLAAPVYGIDARSGMHVQGTSAADQPSYLFAPPGIKKGESFLFWHPSYSVPARMNYVAEEDFLGLRLYKYEREKSEPLDQTKMMGFLPGVPEDRGVKLASSIALWIEPVSGRAVRVEDYSTDYFFFDIKTGVKQAPYNKFYNIFSQGSIEEQVRLARNERQKIIVIKYVVPCFLLALFLVFLLGRRADKFAIFVKKNFIAVSLFVVSLALTLVSYYFVSSGFQDVVKSRLSSSSNDISRLISKRVEAHFQTIRFGAALFTSHEKVERGEWMRFVEAVQTQGDYPGIQVLGFAKKVSLSGKEPFISSFRRDGFRSFDIKPAGQRETYAVVQYLEPLNEKNLATFGFDLWSVEAGRRAMVRASDSGKATLSSNVALSQGAADNQAAEFLAFAPVYAHDMVPVNATERANDISGFVYASLSMGDLLSGILDNREKDVTFRIYDGLNINPNKLVFDLATPETVSGTTKTTFRRTETLYMGGVPWTIEYFNSPSYQPDFGEAALPGAMLFFGSLMSLLVFWVVFNGTRSTALAVAYSQVVNKELIANVAELKKAKQEVVNVLVEVQGEKKKSEGLASRLSIATKSAQIGVWEWDVVKDVIIWDNQMYKLYGLKKGDFGGAYSAWRQGLHPDDMKAGDDAIQAALKGSKDFISVFRVVWPSGEIRYLKAYAITERDAAGKPLRMIGVNFDITKESLIDREKTEFVSLASHQLKTPVGAIQWGLEMLLEGNYGTLSVKQKQVLKETYGMSSRMNELINALLNISRIEMGALIIEPKPVEFSRICSEVLL